MWWAVHVVWYGGERIDVYAAGQLDLLYGASLFMAIQLCAWSMV